MNVKRDMDKSPISKLDEVKETLSHEEGNWEDIFDDNKFYDGVYLFFSFDLVNSTEFKSKHNGEWKSVFTRFYELVSSQMSYYHPKSLIWRLASLII